MKIHLSKSPHYRGYTFVNEEWTKGVPDHKETLDFGMENEPETERDEPWMALRGPNMYAESMPEMSMVV